MRLGALRGNRRAGSCILTQQVHGILQDSGWGGDGRGEGKGKGNRAENNLKVKLLWYSDHQRLDNNLLMHIHRCLIRVPPGTKCLNLIKSHEKSLKNVKG